MTETRSDQSLSTFLLAAAAVVLSFFMFAEGKEKRKEKKETTILDDDARFCVLGHASKQAEAEKQNTVAKAMANILQMEAKRRSQTHLYTLFLQYLLLQLLDTIKSYWKKINLHLD